MKVIICGAGQVGLGIAERLASENNDVSIIDSQASLVDRANEMLEVRAIQGNGAHPDVLAAAGAADADMIIAVTLYDEVNMVACSVANTLFQTPVRIARIRAQSYLAQQWNKLFAEGAFPIDYVISPEIEVGNAVLRRLEQPGAFETFSFADGNMVAMGVSCGDDCPVVETTLSQLADLFPDLPAVIVAIVRDGELRVARSSDRLMIGDDIYIVVPNTHVKRTLKIFGHDETEARRVIIAGGGNIGLFVAKQLEQRKNIRVKVLEADRMHALEIAEKLKSAVVIHGSSLSEERLREADIQATETIVAVTNDDQVNILTSVLGKQLGCERSLCLWNEKGYANMIRSFGIDSQVNPRGITTSRILQYVRRGRIRGVHAIHNGRGELIEGEALETSPLIGKPISELKVSDNVRIGGVWRGGKPVNIRGTTELQPKDRVIMFARAEEVRAVERMFRVAPDYFA
jgi:trk system potassium uptake protein TrkA